MSLSEQRWQKRVINCSMQDKLRIYLIQQTMLSKYVSQWSRTWKTPFLYHVIVQACAAEVAVYPMSNFIGWRFGNELIINWLPLFTVLSITLALNICHLCYTPTPQHVSFAPPPSIFSPNLVTRLLSPIVCFRHTGPSIWNSLPPHPRSIDTYTAFKSNLKTPLFCSASISGP